MGKLHFKLTRWLSTEPMFYQFSRYFSFCCRSISIKRISSCILCVYTFGIGNFRDVGFHLRIMVMCITVEVVSAPEIFRRRAFSWIIVVSGNPGIQKRYLGPQSYPFIIFIIIFGFLVFLNLHYNVLFRLIAALREATIDATIYWSTREDT